MAPPVDFLTVQSDGILQNVPTPLLPNGVTVMTAADTLLILDALTVPESPPIGRD
jgi:hypothetical protein